MSLLVTVTYPVSGHTRIYRNLGQHSANKLISDISRMNEDSCIDLRAIIRVEPESRPLTPSVTP